MTDKTDKKTTKPAEMAEAMQSRLTLERECAELRNTVTLLHRAAGKPRPQRAAWITLVLTAAMAAMVLWLRVQMPDPVACPPPVECPPAAVVAEEGAAVAPSSLADDRRGYTTEDDPFGRPWPSAAGYPAEQFRADCTAVCEVPELNHRGGEPRDIPGRVLMVDPAHLVCVCFHDHAPYPVDRWIGWEHIR